MGLSADSSTPKAPGSMIFRYLDAAGDGSGNKNFTGNYAAGEELHW
jgi:hypothetical protein